MSEDIEYMALLDKLGDLRTDVETTRNLIGKTRGDLISLLMKIGDEPISVPGGGYVLPGGLIKHVQTLYAYATHAQDVICFVDNFSCDLFFQVCPNYTNSDDD